MDLDLLCVGSTLVVTSVRELLLVMKLFFFKYVMEVCLVLGLVEGPCIDRKGAGTHVLMVTGFNSTVCPNKIFQGRWSSVGCQEPSVVDR